MIITIDILSLILGITIGIFGTMIGIVSVYFNDKWDTAFGSGWEAGRKYGKEEVEKENKNNEAN